jgi:hypothetical protein
MPFGPAGRIRRPIGRVEREVGMSAVGATPPPQDSALANGSKAGAGLVANGTQTPADTTKLPDPIPATSVDTSAANANGKWKDLPKPGAGIASVGGGTGRPQNGKPAAPGTQPGKPGTGVAGGPGGPGTPPSAMPPPIPPIHTATVTPPPPPKGKVDESGF